MRESIAFVKTCVAGGFFVLLPLVILGFFFRELNNAIDGLLVPIAERFPVETVGGVEIAFLLGLAAIVLLCFLAGVLLRTRVGASLNEAFERSVLDRIPGYRFVRTLTDRFDASQSEAVVLIREGSSERWTLGILVEEVDDGHAVVFVPLAPTPTVGTVMVVSRDALRILDASAGAAMNTIMQWGVGTGPLVAGRLG